MPAASSATSDPRSSLLPPPKNKHDRTPADPAGARRGAAAAHDSDDADHAFSREREGGPTGASRPGPCRTKTNSRTRTITPPPILPKPTLLSAEPRVGPCWAALLFVLLYCCCCCSGSSAAAAALPQPPPHSSALAVMVGGRREPGFSSCPALLPAAGAEMIGPRRARRRPLSAAAAGCAPHHSTAAPSGGAFAVGHTNATDALRVAKNHAMFTLGRTHSAAAFVGRYKADVVPKSGTRCIQQRHGAVERLQMRL